MILYVLLFALAAVGDILTLWWHRLREQGQGARMALVSMFLEVLSWVPLWLAITLDDWKLAAVSILGSGAGTYLGFKRKRTEPAKAPPKNENVV